MKTKLNFLRNNPTDAFRKVCRPLSGGAKIGFVILLILLSCVLYWYYYFALFIPSPTDAVKEFDKEMIEFVDPPLSTPLEEFTGWEQVIGVYNC